MLVESQIVPERVLLSANADLGAELAQTVDVYVNILRRDLALFWPHLICD